MDINYLKMRDTPHMFHVIVFSQLLPIKIAQHSVLKSPIYQNFSPLKCHKIGCNHRHFWRNPQQMGTLAEKFSAPKLLSWPLFVRLHHKDGHHSDPQISNNSVIIWGMVHIMYDGNMISNIILIIFDDLMYMNETFPGFHNSWMFRWSSSGVDVGCRWGIEPAKTSERKPGAVRSSDIFRSFFHFFPATIR